MFYVAKRDKRTMLIVALLIVFAVLLRQAYQVFGNGTPATVSCAILRSLIYIGLFAAWGYSLRKRIVQPQIRRYLVAIAFFMVFWMAVRSLKFFILLEQTVPYRFAWYAYYIPMLLIPMLALFAAVSLGKPEGYRTPKRLRLLWIPTLLLVTLVLTNDLHQMVFCFPPGSTWSDDAYSYAVGYWLVTFWGLGSAVIALGIILRKCRIPHSKKFLWLPLIPFALIVVYVILYITVFPVIQPFLGDMATVFCVLIAAIFESCIQCRLIPSNTRYGELFRASGITAQITDNDYRVVLSSNKSMTFPTEVMRRTEAAPVMLPDNIRLFGAPIQSGHVLWTEDMSELAAVLQKLSDNKEELESGNEVLQKNYRITQSIRKLVEQNRLYDDIERQTAGQIALSATLLRQFQTASDETEKRRLLGKLVVIGAYLKRRNNLFFISEQSKMLPVRELELCLEESFDNLKLYGVSCGWYLRVGDDIPASTAMLLYDFFEAATETALDTLRSMMLRIFTKSSETWCCVDIDCDADFTPLATDGISYERGDDGTATLTLRLPKGGEAQ